jgi:YesN/AraC family two-component response regulator
LCVPNTSLSERDIAKVNFIKAKVYVLDNHYDSALVTLRRSLNLVNRQNDCDLLSSIYEWMASYNLKLGDKRSADTCMIRAYEIDRKYFNIQKFTTMRNIKASYDINKKDQQVALISEKKHTQELFFFIVLTCATVVILLGIVLYIGKRRQLQMTRKLYRNMVLKLNVDAREQKYKASNLEYEDKMKLLDKIIDVMKNCDEVYQMNFDLERLAHIVDAKSRYISQVINELCEKNFNALLAEYRVREACKRMRDKEHFGNISIEGIALSVGFKSRTNFAKIFKRETGLTPSEFYRMTR